MVRVTTAKTVDVEPGTRIGLAIRHAAALPDVEERDDGTVALPAPSSLHNTPHAVY
jgi:hypothetical protein